MTSMKINICDDNSIDIEIQNTIRSFGTKWVNINIS